MRKDEGPTRASQRLPGWTLLLLVPLTVMAGLAMPYLNFVAQAQCGDGVNASANFFGVIVAAMFVVPFALLVVIGCWAIPDRGVATAALLVVLVVVLLNAGRVNATPTGYQGAEDPTCVGGLPPWWPGYLPR